LLISYVQPVHSIAPGSVPEEQDAHRGGTTTAIARSSQRSIAAPKSRGGECATAIPTTLPPVVLRIKSGL
jgi:hypothetical protein